MSAPASPAALLELQAERWPGRPLFVLPARVAALWDSRAVWTYAEAAAEVAAIRALWRAAGWGAGQRVALLLENRPAHFLHWLALNGLGVSILPLNPDAPRAEAARLLAHAGAAAVVALPERRATVAGLGPPVLTPGERPPPPPAPPAPAAPPGAGECALIYTSGSTGAPKGCLLSDAYFLAWGAWYAAQPAPVALAPGAERLMTPLPAFHVNAIAHSFMGMLATGGAQVIQDRFHPRTWWTEAAETGATAFHYLGVMPAILLALPPAPEDRAHGLRFGLGGGVHPDHHAAFEARFGVPLLEGWAMTESGGACLLCAVAEPRHVGRRCIGHPGRPGPAMEARIVDADGRPLPPGEIGELEVRAAGPDPGRGLFSGYLDDSAATAAIWRDGWLRTGDLMRQDAQGFLYFVDRLKNIVRRSGETIPALEVEAALAAHPEVAGVAVLAAPDPLREEEVLAAVVPRAPRAPREEAALAAALLDHAAARLAYHKLPGWVVFLDALPVTSTQKLRRGELAAIASDPAAHPRAHDLRALKQARRPRRGAGGDPGTAR